MMIALSQYVSLTIIAALAAAIGGVVVPTLADRLLKRKLRLWRAWFDRSAAGYAEFAAREGRAPSAAGKGEEGALGLWAEDALRLAAQGALDTARSAKIEELGLVDEREESRRAIRREVGKVAAAAKATAKASLPKGGNA